MSQLEFGVSDPSARFALRSASDRFGETHAQIACCACECCGHWSSRARRSRQCERGLLRLRGGLGRPRRRRRGRDCWQRHSEQSATATAGLLPRASAILHRRPERLTRRRRLMLSWHQVVIGDTGELTQRRNLVFRYETSFSKVQSTVGASGGVDRSRRSGARNSDELDSSI